MGHALPLSAITPVLPARTRTRSFASSSSPFPGSEWIQLLRRVYDRLSATSAESLADLKQRLLKNPQEQDHALIIAQAVLYRLLCRLESTFSGCLQWSLNEQSFEALLRTVAPGQIESLFVYARSLKTAQAPSDTLTLATGLAGNGSLLAVMQALSQRDPEYLQNLIQTDGPDYLVVFPGCPALNVNAPTQIEQLVFAGGSQMGPVLIEKAAAAVCPDAYADADNGPGPLLAQALELLCGHPAELYDTALTPVKGLRQVMIDSLAAGQVLVAAGNQYPWLQPVSADGQLLAEAYALIAYEADSDSVKLLRAQGQDSPRNAQGESLSSSPEQSLTVPMQAFATYFGHLGVARITLSGSTDLTEPKPQLLAEQIAHSE